MEKVGDVYRGKEREHSIGVCIPPMLLVCFLFLNGLVLLVGRLITRAVHFRSLCGRAAFLFLHSNFYLRGKSVAKGKRPEGREGKRRRIQGQISGLIYFICRYGV